MIGTIAGMDIVDIILWVFISILLIGISIVIARNVKIFMQQRRIGMNSVGLYVPSGKKLRKHYLNKTWSEIRLVMIISGISTIVATAGMLFVEDIDMRHNIVDLNRTIINKDATIENTNIQLAKIDKEYKLLYDTINIPPNIGGFDVSFDDLDNVPVGCPIEPTSFWISSYFGRRLNPFTKEPTAASHDGLDIVGPPAAQIMTTATGVVEYVGWDPDGIYGRMIKIDHQNGFETLYAHLSKIYVNVGDEVTLKITQLDDGILKYDGTVIGRQGSTGLTTGPHLHYGVLWHGEYINPLLFISSYVNKDPELVNKVVRIAPDDDDPIVKTNTTKTNVADEYVTTLSLAK